VSIVKSALNKVSAKATTVFPVIEASAHIMAWAVPNACS